MHGSTEFILEYKAPASSPRPALAQPSPSPAPSPRGQLQLALSSSSSPEHVNGCVVERPRGPRAVGAPPVSPLIPSLDMTTLQRKDGRATRPVLALALLCGGGALVAGQLARDLVGLLAAAALLAAQVSPTLLSPCEMGARCSRPLCPTARTPAAA